LAQNNKDRHCTAAYKWYLVMQEEERKKYKLSTKGLAKVENKLSTKGLAKVVCMVEVSDFREVVH
jgi:hypothetical protein